MKYTIASARWTDAARRGVELTTAEAGSVMLDLTLAADNPRRNQPEVRAFYETWLAEGNTPQAFVPPPPPPPSRDPLAEIDQLKTKLAAAEAEIEKLKPPK